jgi:ankyrin repeat protein
VWLLEHGANPNVLCAREQETTLHLASRRGQDVSIIQLLLDAGADVNTRRADRSTAWFLAKRGGFDAIANLLEEAGAETEALSPVDELLAACGRADTEAAKRLATQNIVRALSAADLTLLPDAAAANRWPTVAACIAAGFAVDTTEATGATAIHYAALRGNAEIVRLLLAARADLSIRDREHSSSPLGWATWGADFIRDSSGDYPATIRALGEAGGKLGPNEHVPQDVAARAAFEESVKTQ